MNQQPTSFQLVSMMNEAFGNKKGNPNDIDWTRIRKQSVNILHEFGELMVALGAPKAEVDAQVEQFDAMLRGTLYGEVDIDKVRDSSRDIVVFTDGVHHLMGIDGDRDMVSVITAVMSRFVKDEKDLEDTKAMHAAKGVTQTYTEGTYPTMVLKSAVDQPDAPQGKFLKSASRKEPVFYDVNNPDHQWDGDGERCMKCGDKDWMGGPCSGGKKAA